MPDIVRFHWKDHQTTLTQYLNSFIGPPGAGVTSSIILSTLIIKTMSYLMSNHHTNSTKIQVSWPTSFEEWRLQDSSRESYDKVNIIKNLIFCLKFYLLCCDLVNTKHWQWRGASTKYPSEVLLSMWSIPAWLTRSSWTTLFQSRLMSQY